MSLGRNAPLIVIVAAGLLALGLGMSALLRTPIAADGGRDQASQGPAGPSRPVVSMAEADGASDLTEDPSTEAARKAVPEALASPGVDDLAVPGDSRRLASLHGVVRHHRGAVPGATVSLTRLPDRDAMRRRWRRGGESSPRREPDSVASTKTDPEGGFRLDAVPPGDRYVLAIDAQGFSRVSLAGVVLVEGEDADAGRIDLLREARVSGVVREDGGPPLGGVEVSAVMASGGGPLRAWLPPAASATTAEEDGRFDLRGLPPGRYEVVASREGFVGARSEARELLEGEAARDLVLTLRQGLALEGRVVDPAGQPVAGARVAARPARGSSRRPSFFLRPGEEAPPRPVRTDDSGRFRIQGLREQGYAVSAFAKGHGPATIPRVVPGGGSVELRLQGTATIRGTLRDPSSGAPAKLPPKTSIADGITLHPSGTGRWAWLAAGAEDEDRPRATADHRGPGTMQGDARAFFRFEGVPSGTWIVRASVPGFVEAESEELALREGEVREVRLMLDPGVSIEGIAVLEGTNDPAAGAEITAARSSGAGVEARGRRGRGGFLGRARGREEVLARVETGADGTFRLEHLPRAVLEVAGRHEGHLASVPLEVDLTGGAAPGTIVLPLRLPGRLEGTVTTWNGTPARGVHVTAARVDAPGDIARAFTKEDGTYAFRALDPGGYRVEAEVRPAGSFLDPSSFILRRLRDRFRARRGEEDDRGVLVELASGEGRRVDLTLPAPTSVTGRVSESGHGVAGLRLTLQHASGDAGGGRFAPPAGLAPPQGFTPPAGFTTTGVLGEFVFEDVPPGTYAVTARPPGAPATSSDPVEVAAGEQARIDLVLPASTIVVRVVDDARGKPIARAEVRLEEVAGGGAGGGSTASSPGSTGSAPGAFSSGAAGSGGNSRGGPGAAGSPLRARGRLAREIRRRFGQRTVRAGDDGRARIEHVPPGTYTATASADGYGEGASETIVLDAQGGVREIDLRLVPGGWITGVVRDATGAPLRRVRVTADAVEKNTAAASAAPATASTRTGPDGTFVLAGLRPGPWRARATSRGSTVEAPVTIRAGRASEVELIVP